MKRNKNNPILTRNDIPEVLPRVVNVSSVFNPGAVKFGDTYLLMLRVQLRSRETVLMEAESTDGENFTVRPRYIAIKGIQALKQKIYHLYDPRITQIDDMYYITLAADTKAGCKLATIRTREFKRYELVWFDFKLDARNCVLFPEQVSGHYLRLERPNRMQAGGVAIGAKITLSSSTNLRDWRDAGSVMEGRPHYWDELIGAGPPPIKTRAGWLLIYHGVATHFASSNIYQAGVALLDLDDPRQVLARSRYNILEPREPYELTGQVPNVVFPSGMIVEKYDAEGYARPESLVRVYYGAADTCVCMATTTIQELIDSCEEQDGLS